MLCAGGLPPAEVNEMINEPFAKVGTPVNIQFNTP